METQLKNAQEVCVPQSSFTVSELPEDPIYHMQSVMVPSETLFTSEGAPFGGGELSDGLILLQDTSYEMTKVWQNKSTVILE